jgi:hypothetical protein
MNARILSVLALSISGASLLACLGIGNKPEGHAAGECTDGADNDTDGFYDCDDPDCFAAPDCQVPETEAGLCYDGEDNDEDGLIDCYDDDCEGSADCPECWDYPYEEFGDDMVQTSCDKFLECDLFSAHFTYDDCLALGDADDGGWECQDYDCDAAEDCVDDWAGISCADLLAGEGLDVCDQVCSND